MFCQNSIPFPHFTTFTSIMWQNPQYWEKGSHTNKTILGKRITYKQNNIGKQTKKASQIFTNNSFTTFLEGDYLLGYVLFFFTMCMLIFFPLGYLLKMAMWAIANILQYFGKLFDYQIVCACDPSKIFFLFFCFFLTLEFIM